MTSLDTVSWEGMGEYGMGYPIKYTTPFRPVDVTPLDIVPWEDMVRYDMGYPTKYITPFRPVA